MGDDNPQCVAIIKFVQLLNPLKPAATASEQFQVRIFLIV